MRWLKTLLTFAGLIASAMPAYAQDIPEFDIPEIVLPDFEIPEFEPLPPPPAIEIEPYVPDEPWRPTDLYGAETRRVSDLENLVYTDEEAAKTQAREFRIELQTERAIQLTNEESAQRRVDGWQDLVTNSEADAARNRQRAKDALADINATMTDEEKAERRRQADFWEEQARGDDTRAEERKREAQKHLKDAESTRDRVALLDELIARLDKIINRQPDENQTSSAEDTQQPSQTPDEKPVRADYEMTLERSLGIWRPNDDFSKALVIVQKTPDSEDRTLELHTRERVWQGQYNVLSRDERATKPRLSFSYYPKADEMNPEIPAQARAAIEGQLVWRLEAFESGSRASPALTFEFYRGRVRWKDDTPAEARLDGDGPPKRFEATPDAVLATKLAAPTLLYVSLANKRHDPSLRTIEAVTHGMPLRVHVIASSTSAKEIGSTLSVDVTSPSGGSTTLQLTRQRVTDDNRLVYGHSGVITIGGDAPAREYAPFAAPPRRIYGWISSALGLGEIEPGPRLSVLPDNGDTIEFRYGDASQEMTVYRSWVQRLVAQYNEQINTMAATYGGILTSGQSSDVKAQARDRLRMLANYQLLAASEDLTDIHRVAIAESYIGGPNGRQLLNFSKADLQKIATTFRRGDITIGETNFISPDTWLSLCGPMSSVAYAKSLEAPDLQGREATSEEVGDAIQRQALAFLGHEGIQAVDVLTNDELEWVHPLERDCLDRVLVAASRDLLTRSLKDYGTSLAFGLYEGVAMASGADDIAVAFFETDIHGNKVPQYSLPWWVSTLSVAFDVAGAFDDAISLGRKSADDDIWKLATKNIPDTDTWSDTVIKRATRWVTKHVPATEGAGDAFRTILRRSDGSVDEVAEAADDALSDLPKTLTPAQRKQTYMDMVSLEEVEDAVPLPNNAKPKYADQIGDAKPLGNALHDPNLNAAQINPRTGVANWYGNDAKSLGNLGGTFCQAKNEHGCEGVSAAFMIFEEEKILMNEELMHGNMFAAHVNRNIANGVPRDRAIASFIDNQYGIGQGYLSRDVAYYLRQRGYEVHALNPARGGQYNLQMLSNAINNKYRLRVGIRKPGQPSGGHAVVVTAVTRGNAPGKFDEVVFFCPTQGGYLKMKADVFERWMIQNVNYDVVYAMRKANPPTP